MRRHALLLTPLFATLVLLGCAIQQGSMPRPQWDPALASVRPYLEEGAVVTRYQMQSLPEGYLRIVDVETADDQSGKVTSKRYFIWPVAMAAEARKEISRKGFATLGASSYFEDGKCGVLVVDCGQPGKFLSAGAYQYEAAPAEVSLPEASLPERSPAR
jgi:hypothetical protein